MSRVKSSSLDRRQFLWLVSCASGSLALSQATGCATNPVTGESQFMLVSEQEEIAIDKQHAPHQFSQDMGVTQDNQLNGYVKQVGAPIANVSPRKHMPFNFQVVNANYINAYAFPGGSIAATRGIMLEMKSEDELAALMGHEIGHVNARHSAERMSKGVLAQLVTLGLGAYIGSRDERLGQVGLLLGGIAAGALLAHYSRENERQADSLGMLYADKTGYNPQGMVSLMGMLRDRSNHKANAVELMFATHPMSDERYNTAQKTSQKNYRGSLKRKLKVQRYNDNIASLRKIAPSIEAQQQGEAQLAKKDVAGAIASYKQALSVTPNDYPALVGLSRLQMVAGNSKEGEAFAKQATRVYPREAQGHNLLAVASLEQKKPEQALTALSNYDKILPGNPNSEFLRGVSFEQMGRKSNAAQSFNRYLKKAPKGDQASYARSRLQQFSR